MCTTLRILLVDDDIDLCRVLGLFFKDKGHEIVYVHDRDQALDIFEQQEFDLILLDENLPNGSGLGVIEDLLKMNPHIPIIVLSGYYSRGMNDQALELGAIGCITKDIDVKEIIPRIESVLEKYRVTSFS